MQKYSLNNSINLRKEDLEYLSTIDKIWNADDSQLIDKLKNFTSYVPHTEFTKLFVKYELFKMIKDYHGSIIECGVHQGNGIMTWSILSNIFEPTNHIRKIYGFDTFFGFPDFSNEDHSQNENLKKNGFKTNSYENILKTVNNFDSVRHLGHIKKVQLIKGDAVETIPEFLSKNKHLLISLLYLDFDIYSPTKIAIKYFKDRMHKGSIIVFDEVNNEMWPGETLAFIETLNIRDFELKRFFFNPQISYIIL
jgi:hypothetical protein